MRHAGKSISLSINISRISTFSLNISRDIFYRVANRKFVSVSLTAFTSIAFTMNEDRIIMIMQLQFSTNREFSIKINYLDRYILHGRCL